MFRNCIARGALTAAFVLAFNLQAFQPPTGEVSATEEAKSASAKAPIILAAHKPIDSQEACLVSEVFINGVSLGSWSSNREMDVTSHLKPGKNSFKFVTAPRQAGSKDYHLSFKLGAVHENPRTKNRVMRPVLMIWRNNHEWESDEDGKFTHPFGPNPKTPDQKSVTVSFTFDYAGVAADLREPKEGDYILTSNSALGYCASVVPTISINGKSFGSFHAGERGLVVTDALKAGDNEIGVSTTPVAGQLDDIDIGFELIGPVSYDIAKKKWIGKRVTSFKAQQGWKRNKTTHVLEVQGQPGVVKLDRKVEFRLEAAPK